MVIEQGVEIEQISAPSLGSRATSGAAWLFIDVVGVQGLSLVVFAVMARFVSTSDVGLISIAFLVTQSVKVLLMDVVSVSIARKRNPTDLDYTSGFWLTTTIALLTAGVIAASAGLLESVFRAPGLQPVMIMMSTTVVLTSLSSTHESWLSRNFRFRSLALRALIGSLAGAVIGVALALHGFGVTALVAQQLAMSLTSMTLLWLLCPWKPRWAISKASVWELLLFSRTLLGSSLLSVVSQNGDTALVALFFGPTGAGIYSVGRRVRLAVLLVAWSPLNGVVLPIFAELQSDRVRLQRVVTRSFTLISGLCAPLFFGIAAVANEAVFLIFGEKWVAATPVVAILAVGAFAQIIIMHNERIFVTQARPSWCLHVSLLYIALAIPAFFLLGGRSTSAVAWPFVLPYVIVLPFSMYLALTLIGIRLRVCLAAIMPGAVASIIMFVVVWWIGGNLQLANPLLRIFILGGAGAAVYVSLLAIIGRHTLSSVWDIWIHFLQRVHQ